MKCPKCHYIGFNEAERCKNCGYDFSLAFDADDEKPDTGLDHDKDPLADFVIGQREQRTAPSRDHAFDLDDLHIPPPVASRDLPLFQAPVRQRDVIAARAQPRAPLAVRRATPDPTRLRAARAALPKLREPELDLQPAFEEPSADEAPATATAHLETEVVAPLSARIAAGLIDISLLFAIDVVVVYLTLRVCGLSSAELRILPFGPMLAFFALLNGGYFFAFTAANGQSIGKMAAGIRVVTPEGGRVPLGTAAVRTAAYLLSTAPVGLGFLAAVAGTDRLTLHDRLAHTRVVPAQEGGA